MVGKFLGVYSLMLLYRMRPQTIRVDIITIITHYPPPIVHPLPASFCPSGTGTVLCGGIVSIFQYSMKMQHHRAQTVSFHRQKHQDAMLKQIKSVAELTLPFSHHRNTVSSHLKSRPRSANKSGVLLSLPQQLQQILKIRGKPAKEFSFEKDQKRVCQQGWAEFAEKTEEDTHKDLEAVRGKVRRLKKKRATVSSICTRGGLSPQEASRCDIGQEPLGKLLAVVHGEHGTKQWLKSTEVDKRVKGSLVLTNAYRACLQSKNYQRCQKWQGQTLNAWVYLRENAHKLPQKQLGDIYRSNWLLP